MYMTDNDVESLWDYQEAQEAFGKYFSDSADADIRRVRLRSDRPNEGVAFVMIGASESLKILTTKTIAFNRRNRRRGLSFGDGALVCMEWPGGQLRGFIAARAFTALRLARLWRHRIWRVRVPIGRFSLGLAARPGRT